MECWRAIHSPAFGWSDPAGPEFFSFDYVLEPNYSTNRGYTLDDTGDMTLDEVDAAIYDEQLRGMIRLLDSVSDTRDRQNEVIEHLRAENEQLLSLLASGKGGAGAVLDAAYIAPVVAAMDPVERMKRDAGAFRSLDTLPSCTAPQAEPAPAGSLYERLMGRFGVGR